MNKSDRIILTEIQKDCRISNQDLADRAQLSASACWRRVRALEDQGVIKGYAARIDRQKLGLEFAAMTHVTLTRHDARHVEVFVAAIQARPEVLECFATTGAADYHLRVVCRDVAAYNDFLEHFLFHLPGISNVQTNLILRDIKAGAPIAIATP